MRPIVLLGPQRFTPTVADTVRSMEVDGPVATVTAGWQEREPDDGELDELLDGRSVNLRLFARWHDALERDPELAAAERRRQDVLDELVAVYQLRLHHAVEAVYELQRRVGDREVTEAAIADAIEALRMIDERHLDRVAEAREELEASLALSERDVVAEHRAAVRQLIDEAGAVAIAGGHVVVLLECLRLFDLAGALDDTPVVAWSAAAMALTERVVLFHDLAVHGRGHAEVHDAGLALCRGVVALPHARRRLQVDDHRRMAVLARRFAPARCLVLDDGVRVDCPDGVCQLTGVTVSESGQLVAAAA